MVELGYEIKCGKLIAFNHEDKERFTGAKTIREDYSEESLKERISENANQKIFAVKTSYCKIPNSKQFFEELKNKKRIPLCQSILHQNLR